MSTLPPSDALKELFLMQEKFSSSVGVPIGAELTDQQKSFWINQHCNALSNEVEELRDSIPWKWWKKSEPDFQNAKVEVVDLFHFVIASALILGMTPEDLLEAYKKKMEVNIRRQQLGYTKETKDPTDCKHI